MSDKTALERATNLFNRWSSQCAVNALDPVEQARLLIYMMAEALEEVEDLKERIKELERQVPAKTFDAEDYMIGMG